MVRILNINRSTHVSSQILLLEIDILKMGRITRNIITSWGDNVFHCQEGIIAVKIM